jgi:curved DNA-binding protein CbpA
MARINHAIDVLGDRDKRRKYDETLWESGHREARVEAERTRQARAQEIRAEEVEAFAAALEGNPPARFVSVAPPSSARASHPRGDDEPVLAGYPQERAGLRPWQAVGRSRGPSPLRRRAGRD